MLTGYPSDPSTWHIKDNLFDKTAIYLDGVDHAYNGYVTNFSRITSTQATDVVLTNSPIYQTSYLGRYYYPTNGGLLSRLINAGSRSAYSAGLYQYTTTTNQAIELDSTVDIGFHFGYAIDVRKDLLLIYNTNSTDSSNVWYYYMQHRPLISGANVRGIGCTNVENITSTTFTNQILNPVLDWLTANPTKHPKYLILFYDIPAIVYDGVDYWSPSYFFRTNVPGMQPFVTCINMRTPNDCKAYIDKLEFFGTNYSPGQLLISASAGGYGNTNYYFDDTELGYSGDAVGLSGFEGVIQNGASSNSVVYTNVYPDCGSSACHITTGTNVAGYFSWGAHSPYLGVGYATNGNVRWFGNSRWWIIQTIESYNGQRDAPTTVQGNFLQWFSATAFGGTSYENTPVGAVSYVTEPGSAHLTNDPFVYFGDWAAGKCFARCAWISSQRPQVLQAVGDPFVSK